MIFARDFLSVNRRLGELHPERLECLRDDLRDCEITLLKNQMGCSNLPVRYNVVPVPGRPDRMPVSANSSPIAITISPMKRVTVSCTKPPLPLPPRRETIRIKRHITVVATATRAVTGNPN